MKFKKKNIYLSILIVLILEIISLPTVLANVTAPSNLHIDRVFDNNLILVWQSNGENETYLYEIYDGEVLLGSTEGTMYVVTDLTNETSYAFKVRAKNIDGMVSGFSNIAAVYHIQVQLLPPINLRIDAVGQNTVTLKWDAPINLADLQEYVIFNEDIAVGSTSENTYIISGLINEDTHVFTVKSSNGTALSKSSNVVLHYHVNEDN